jgi:hypothetical protein
MQNQSWVIEKKRELIVGRAGSLAQPGETLSLASTCQVVHFHHAGHMTCPARAVILVVFVGLVERND